MDQPRGHTIYQSNEECAAEKDPKSSRCLVVAVPCRAGLVVGNGITERGSLITKTMRGSGTNRSQVAALVGSKVGTSIIMSDKIGGAARVP